MGPYSMLKQFWQPSKINSDTIIYGPKATMDMTIKKK
jgi:hypothetical protein